MEIKPIKNLNRERKNLSSTYDFELNVRFER